MNNMILGRYIPGNSIIHQSYLVGSCSQCFYSYFFCFGRIIPQTNVLLFGFVFVLMLCGRGFRLVFIFKA